MTSLTASCPKVTIAGLNRLNGLSRMERIHIHHLKRGGAILDLSGMTNLEDIILSFERKSADVFTDADLVSLAGLKRLKGLQIGPRGYTDKGVASLRGLTGLKKLSIGGAGLTDEAFRHVGKMKKLELLHVSSGAWDTSNAGWDGGGNFTDKALSYLEGLTQLNTLEISSDHVFSWSGVQRLYKALPGMYRLNVKTDRTPARRTSATPARPPNRQTRRPTRGR
jgi:hypothetical protein